MEKANPTHLASMTSWLLSGVLLALSSVSTAQADALDHTFTQCAPYSDPQAQELMRRAASWPQSMSHYPDRFDNVTERQAHELGYALKQDLNDFDKLYEATRAISKQYCHDNAVTVTTRLLKKQLVAQDTYHHIILYADFMKDYEPQVRSLKERRIHLDHLKSQMAKLSLVGKGTQPWKN